MSASLVGSEMCIRDSCCPSGRARDFASGQMAGLRTTSGLGKASIRPDNGCLLYTSDAADDM
eukprot:11615303-Alexandrium_andersonii.AAC.1